MAELNIHICVTPRIARYGLTALCLGLMSVVVSPESITLSTYYPAPSGIYVKMVTTSDTYLARDSGDVGIRTTTPGELLDIESSGTHDGLKVGNSGGNSFDLFDDGSGHIEGASGSPLYINGDNNASTNIGAAGGNTIINSGGGTTTIDSGGGNTILNSGGGRVGIGTGAPKSALDVAGDATITLESSGQCTPESVCGSFACPGGEYATWQPGVYSYGDASGDSNADTPGDIITALANAANAGGYASISAMFQSGTPSYNACVSASFYCCSL